MNRALTSLFSAALLGTAALAQAAPAIYQNGTLTIAQGGLFTDQREVYYTDIQLSTDAQGKLVIVGATRMDLATVETVDAVVNDDSTVTLEVSGYTSLSCLDLLEPAVAQTDEGFTILLAQTTQGPTELCAQETGPFDIDIPLDVSGLEPGIYDVRVNDVEASFELPASL